MNLRVTDHFPKINQSGIFINETINIYFNQAINPNTINWQTFSLNDNYSYATVVGTIGPIWASGINLSGVTSGLAFIPTTNMLPNTEYSVFVYGRPNGVIAKDGSEMVDTYTYSFITGTGYYTTTGTTGAPTGVYGSDYSVDLSGLTYLDESGIVNFSVYSTTPKNQTPNLSGVGGSGLSYISVVFTGTISTPSGDLSNYITITEESVL